MRNLDPASAAHARRPRTCELGVRLACQLLLLHLLRPRRRHAALPRTGAALLKRREALLGRVLANRIERDLEALVLGVLRHLIKIRAVVVVVEAVRAELAQVVVVLLRGHPDDMVVCKGSPDDDLLQASADMHACTRGCAIARCARARSSHNDGSDQTAL